MKHEMVATQVALFRVRGTLVLIEGIRKIATNHSICRPQLLPEQLMICGRPRDGKRRARRTPEHDMARSRSQALAIGGVERPLHSRHEIHPVACAATLLLNQSFESPHHLAHHTLTRAVRPRGIGDSKLPLNHPYGQCSLLLYWGVLLSTSAGRWVRFGSYSCECFEKN